MMEPAKVLRAKRRLEMLRRIHGVRKKAFYDILGYKGQYYHPRFLESSVIEEERLVRIANFFNVSIEELTELSDYRFSRLPIMMAYVEYAAAVKRFEAMKIGFERTDLDVEVY